MELIIKPFHGLPCELEVFTINGKAADSDDFGEIMYSKGLAPYESWQGTPINNVIILCDEVYSKDSDYDGVTLITDSIKINLKEEYIKFFDTEWSSADSSIKSYKAYVVNTTMYNWVKQNKV